MISIYTAEKLIFLVMAPPTDYRGRTAVEMGLARMSAMGMGKTTTEKDPTVPFVTFNNGTLPGTGGAPKNETKTGKKFGF
jgi:hypothetical protein